MFWSLTSRTNCLTWTRRQWRYFRREARVSQGCLREISSLAQSAARKSSRLSQPGSTCRCTWVKSSQKADFCLLLSHQTISLMKTTVIRRYTWLRSSQATASTFLLTGGTRLWVHLINRQLQWLTGMNQAHRGQTLSWRASLIKLFDSNHLSQKPLNISFLSFSINFLNMTEKTCLKIKENNLFKIW